MMTCSKLTTLIPAFAAAAFLLSAGASVQALPLCKGPHGPCELQRHVAFCHYEKFNYPKKWVCDWTSVNR